MEQNKMSKRDWQYEEERKRLKKQTKQFRQSRQGRKHQWQDKKDDE